jgi:hypothetical protein
VKTTSLRLSGAAAALAIIAATTPAALARSPLVSTGYAGPVADVSATVHATVNPRGEETSYSFQYGPTATYGSQTPAVSAGAGASSVHGSQAVAGLAPSTQYHYRGVASNASGTTFGKDRVLTTTQPRLTFVVRSSRPLVEFGGETTLSGTLTGAGSPNSDVVLQRRTFPFTGDFANAAKPQVTTGAGAFAFQAKGLSKTTQFRIRKTKPPFAASDPITVTVSAKVVTHVSKTVLRPGGFVLFNGVIQPAHDGAPFSIQRRRNGRWVTIASGATRHGGPAWSRYRKRVRIRHGGLYRVYVRITGSDVVSGAGAPRRIRLR